MENIRLIIWDLDDTFWNGTIAEEKVVINDERKMMINAFVDRGIMNSICSKNDYNTVKNFLTEEKLWDLFVFPKISWNSKGSQIKEIIDQSQLRPESVLFIDDNHINLEEASYFVPSINTSSPEILSGILDNPLFQGKYDKERSRLNQYKVLESKLDDKLKYDSNENFLMDSDIFVEIYNNCDEAIDRIFELVERTNQLNYTKKQITLEQLRQIFSNKDYRCGYVTAHDKYGDYGIIGFFAIIGGKAEHFLFSCRTLGLCIEQWVYAVTGYPVMEILGEPVAELKQDYIPAWINKTNRFTTEVAIASEKPIKVLIIGGCDLDQVAYYLNSKGLSIDTEFNYNYNKHVVHREHSELLRGLKQYTNEEKQFVISKAPFYDSEFFSSQIYSGKYDIVIYSPVIDFSLGIYENKEFPKLKAAYGNFSNPITNRTPELFNGSNKFTEEFSFSGKITPERFLDNLNFIRKNINKNTKLIMLNGSEQDIKHPEEVERYKTHIELNAVIQDFCKMNEDIVLIDVNKFIHDASDHADNIRHYTRQIYYNIAEELASIINGLYQKDMMTVANRKNRFRLKIWIKTILRKIGLYNLGYSIFRKIKK